MQADLCNETLLSLTDAARAVPPIDGRRPHVSTLWRWCRKGIRGIHLEYVRLGHRVCTTEESLARFAHRLADADSSPRSGETKQPKKRTPHTRQREIAQAELDLSKAGI